MILVNHTIVYCLLSENKGLKFLVLFRVQVSVLGLMKNGLPGQVLVPAPKEFKTSWFLVGSWLTWFCSYPMQRMEQETGGRLPAGI